MGHALGEPNFALQQTVVLKEALSLIEESSEEGVIKKLPYRWRRPEDMGLTR